MVNNIKQKIHQMIEPLLAASLFGTQTISVTGFMGPMIAPLLFYLVRVPYVAVTGINAQLVWSDFIQFWRIENICLIGRVVFCIGLVLFCLSMAQWFWFRHKNLGLFNKGLYTKIRHPQFLGIIIMTLGLTIKELIASNGGGLVGVPFVYHVRLGLLELASLWFLQVLGYIAIGLHEERHLAKKFAEFTEYKQKVPFLLPIKNPKIIPEALFTILLVLGICAILFLLPYDFIRVWSYHNIPTFSFPKW